MKAIQVTFDEALLERLDRHPEVRERGRSAVLREATVEYALSNSFGFGGTNASLLFKRDEA